jgi:DNA-binding MarR family transcriptional regulator
MEIRKVLRLDGDSFYVKHLEIINPFLPIKLTPKEIEVLAAFMSLEGELAEDRFGTTARKIVMKKLNITPGGMGNYLKSLKTKGFVFKRHGAFYIAPIVMPSSNKTQDYRFRLVNSSFVESNINA